MVITRYWWCVLSQAFNIIDQNRDGFIDNEDLKDMLASLGVCVRVTVCVFDLVA